jgi:thiol:disulfide interchange protein
MKLTPPFIRIIQPALATTGIMLLLALFTSVVSLGLSACNDAPVKTAEDTTEDVQWVNTPSPEKVVALIPATAKTPVVMFVQADLCAACQTLKPKLRNVSKRFPHLPVLSINLNQKPACEAGASAYQGIMEEFAPAVTPTLVFIEQGGKVHSVVVDDQTEEALLESFTQLDATFKHTEGQALPKTPPVNPNTVLGC